MADEMILSHLCLAVGAGRTYPRLRSTWCMLGRADLLRGLVGVSTLGILTARSRLYSVQVLNIELILRAAKSTRLTFLDPRAMYNRRLTNDGIEIRINKVKQPRRSPEDSSARPCEALTAARLGTHPAGWLQPPTVVSSSALGSLAAR